MNKNFEFWKKGKFGNFECWKNIIGVIRKLKGNQPEILLYFEKYESLFDGKVLFD